MKVKYFIGLIDQATKKYGSLKFLKKIELFKVLQKFDSKLNRQIFYYYLRFYENKKIIKIEKREEKGFNYLELKVLVGLNFLKNYD